MGVIQQTGDRCTAILSVPLEGGPFSSRKVQCDRIVHDIDSIWHEATINQDRVVRWRDETPLEEAQRLEVERYERDGPFAIQYAGQHPAEAALDYLMSRARSVTHRYSDNEMVEDIRRYFDWKAKRHVDEATNRCTQENIFGVQCHYSKGHAGACSWQKP